MPTFRQWLKLSALQSEPTERAVEQAEELVEYEALDPHESALQMYYLGIWSSLCPRRALSGTPAFRALPAIDLSSKPGPTLRLRDTSVYKDLVRWANTALQPYGQVVSANWGLRQPDLNFVATSADNLRNLVGCTGELKKRCKREAIDGDTGEGWPTQINQAGPWVAAIAQETVYALQTAEMYGAKTGMIGVGTQMSRLVVLNAERAERTIALEVTADFRATLELPADGEGPFIPLDALLTSAREYARSIGGFDLRGSDGELDHDSLGRLWAFLLAAASRLANMDDSVTDVLPDHGLETHGDAPTVSCTGDALLLGVAPLRKELGAAADMAEAARANADADGESDRSDSGSEYTDEPEEESSDDDEDTPARKRQKRQASQGGRAIRRRRTSSLTGSPPPQLPGPSSQAAVAPSAAVTPAESRAPQTAPTTEGSGDVDSSYVEDWLAQQRGTRIARSRALFAGRASPDSERTTSDGSIIDPEHMVEMAAALRARVCPVLSSTMDELVATVCGSQRPNSPPGGSSGSGDQPGAPTVAAAETVAPRHVSGSASTPTATRKHDGGSAGGDGKISRPCSATTTPTRHRANTLVPHVPL